MSRGGALLPPCLRLDVRPLCKVRHGIILTFAVLNHKSDCVRKRLAKCSHLHTGGLIAPRSRKLNDPSLWFRAHKIKWKSRPNKTVV